MDNTNIFPTESPNKTNKVLLFIFLGVLIVMAALGSYYLYSQKGAAKNNKAGVSQATPSPNTVSQGTPNPSDVPLIKKTTPVVYNVALKPATVGQPYSAVIQASVDELNVQIFGREGPGMPPGIKLTTCKTEYNSSAISTLAAKSSLVKCTVEGTTTQSGNFTVRIYFAVQNGAAESYKDLPLVVNP